MIYVSKFIDIATGIDDDKVPISVTDDTPPWWKDKHYICYSYLAPGTSDKEAYKYKLYSFSAIDIVNKLLRLSHKKDVILVCYENWQCDILREWLEESGYDSKRYKKERNKNGQQ